jgi:uncharacterized membrane protein YdjX (TVP38/TMEM64 family)
VSHPAHQLVVGLLCLGAGVALAQSGEGAPLPLQPLAAWLLDHPLLAPLLFVLLYALAITLFLPGTLFCLLGGALFGPWLGTVVNVLGATLGATLAFLIARHLAAAMVERHLTATLQQVKKGVDSGGWRFVVFARLIPVIPYDLSNYAFGLCRIPLSPFATATALSLLPRLAIYAYIGHGGISLLSGEGDRLLTLLTMATLLVSLLLVPQLYRRLRQS